MVFQEKKELLELYNAVSGKHYEDPEELEAVMLNIRPGHNQRLMEASRTLREYAEFVERVRKYAKTIVLNEAVERAVTECIAEGILRDFLEKNRSEVIKVCLYEYNQEEHMKFVREEGFRRGHEQGIERGIEQGKQVMSWKKIYAIYVTEVLLYLLLHAAQIRKGLFSPAVFTGILAVLFLWAVFFLLLFLVRKIRKKEGWKRREILFLLLQSVYSIWLGYEFLIGILFF